jgi:hypothetical protein
MTSKLGSYWSVEHRRKEDYQYFSALNPSVIKIMDGGAPDYEWVKQNLPNSLVVARDWALSEQHSDMLANPVATGQRHAQEWNDHQGKLGFDRSKTFILGVNEPHVWEAGVAEALRLYTISLCTEAKKFGLRVGAMQLGVGWPGNNGPDTPPDWSIFHGVEAAIIDNGGALFCDEYWADKGPGENWGWWAGRTLKCPWQVPFVIGECGVDMFVKDTSVGQQNRGWLGHMPPERYAAELWEYTNRMSADPRFVGCCVFASDFQAHEWFSFDVQPAYDAILHAKPADTPPVTIHLPAVGTGDAPQPPTQDNFARARAFVKKWEGGWADDPADPGGATNKGITLGTFTHWREVHGQPAPTRDDLRNLTDAEADDIYRDWYWLASGADKLPWPLSLAHFDTAVNAGPGRAQEMLAKSNGNFDAYLGNLLTWYASIPNFEIFGRGWTNRRADLLLEASKA